MWLVAGVISVITAQSLPLAEVGAGIQCIGIHLRPTTYTHLFSVSSVALWFY